MKHLRLVSSLCLVLFAVVVPSARGADDGARLDLDELERRLGQLEQSAELDPEDRSAGTERYARAIDLLQSAERNRRKAERYTEALESASGRSALLLRALGEAKAPASVDGEASLSELEQRLVSTQAEQARLRSELAELRATVAAEQGLNLTDLLAEAQTALGSVEAQAAALPGGTTAQAQAERSLRLAAVEAATARVEMLRQRLLSRQPRLELWDLEQRRLVRDLASAGERIDILEQAVNAARQSQAEKAAERTQRRFDQLSQTAAAVARALAEDNAELALRLTKIATREETLTELRSKLDRERGRVERYHDSVVQQLAVSGAERHADLGAELLKQRRRLDRTQRDGPDLAALDDEITQARLAQLRLDELWPDESVRSGETTELEQELTRERERVLQDLSGGYRRYIEALVAARGSIAALTRQTDEYRHLLDARLFWIPSTQSVSLGMPSTLGRELRWLFSAEPWRSAAAALKERRPVPWGLAALCLALAGAITAYRRRLRDLLLRQGERVGNVNHDRALYTGVALLLTLLLALPAPLLLASLAAPFGGAEDFSGRLANALMSAAALLFLLEAFRQMCRPNGLAEIHFGWSGRALRVMRGNLPWLIGTLVPVSLLTPLVDSRIDPAMNDAASRIVFAVASLALAYFAHRTLRPGHGVLAKAVGHEDQSRRWIMTFVLHPLGVMLPLMLLALSWWGYHYMALVIEGKLFVTACIVAGAVVLYALILRALAVTERRMTLERLRARRQAERELMPSRQAADDAAEGIPDTLELQEQDLAEINSQTRAFVRMLVLLAGAFALWTLWADVLPALEVFNEIVLWTTSGDGGVAVRVVSLASLSVAVLIAFLTYFAARNVPGSLEVSVLRRLHVEPGTSYAVRTLATYFIVLVGLLIVLNLLGAQWSKLQWLVAALGVGLGFGLQEIVANFVSGLLILFERPIRVGDTVTVGTHTGTVTRIRIRATTLTDWDRKEQIIPNKTFITEQLTNWTLSDSITRVIIKVGVAYGSDVALVHGTLSEVVDASARVVSDPSPAVFFVGFGESSLNFELRVFVKTMLDIMPLTHELHVAIARALEEKGIEVPFPQRDIRIRTEP